MVESFSPFTSDIPPYVMRNGCSFFDIGLEVKVKTIKNTRIKANIFSFPVVSHTLGGELLEDLDSMALKANP